MIGVHDDHDSDQGVDADEKDGDRVCQDLSRFVNCSPYCTALLGEISSERDGTKKMMKNLNIIQISHLTFECS